jgi:hypothetical protein
MKWVGNVPVRDSTNYTTKGCFIGRPHANPAFGSSVDDLEKQGLVGVYEPDQTSGNGFLGHWVHVVNPDGSPGVVDIGPGQNPCTEVALSDPTAGPSSNIDDRIKEVQQAKPKNFRARWNGTKYVYEPI